MLGERIKESRLLKGMTQEELGAYLGVGKSTINKYEMGKIKVPSDNIEIIAKALGVSPSYLMGWDEEEETETDDELLALISNFDEEAKNFVLAFAKMSPESRKRVLTILDLVHK